MVAITGWTVDYWPFSMVKFLDYYTLIFKDFSLGGGGVGVYEAYCGTDDVWDASLIINDLGTNDPPNTYPINIDIADFGWFYVLSYANISASTLGVYCYIREPGISSATTAVRSLPVDACPEFITCCNFNGQPLIGGIVSTDEMWTRLGSCSVSWGAIGQWEFRPDQNKTAGYIKMPWSDWDEGLVHKVAKLGNQVMVYGNGGRANLVPYSNSLATGFGLGPVMGTGISKGFHMAGDNQLHGFVDTNNEFWVVDGNLKFDKLGYKEWFTDLLAENAAEAVGTPMIVSYDKENKRFYIGGFSSGYVLTEFGLYSCHQSCTSIGVYRGNVLTGFFKDLEDYEGRIKIDDIDFKQRGLKTLDHVEYGVTYTPSGSETVTAGADYKYDSDETHRTGDWKRGNKQGMFYSGLTASDFRIKFKVSDYRDGDPKIDSVKARMKMVDKRSIRGQYDFG